MKAAIYALFIEKQNEGQIAAISGASVLNDSAETEEVFACDALSIVF